MTGYSFGRSYSCMTIWLLISLDTNLSPYNAFNALEWLGYGTLSFKANVLNKIDMEIYRLFFKKVEMQALMRYYDVDGDGQISVDEFLRGLRDSLTERREAMVWRAFSLMDRDGSGQIEAKDVAHLYDVSQHREFIEGSKTKDEILDEFLNSFDGVQGNNDGIISKDEWFEYYTDLSVSVPSDDYFVQMMESTWNMCEDESDEEYTGKISQYVCHVNSQLRNLTSGSDDLNLLQKIYDDFDLNQNGMITIDEFANMIAKLEISVERKYLRGIFRHIDLNKSGAVEFDEFANFACTEM
jgi:Ca2+-binding EF-hand superfamily protein